MMALKVLPLLAVLFLLGAAREQGDKKAQFKLISKCKDPIESKTAECVEFCGKNPVKCLAPSFRNLTHNRLLTDGPLLDIQATTFNIDANDPPSDLNSWLHAVNDPDLFIVGLQELVRLEASTIVKSTDKQQKKWIDAVTKALPKYYQFVLSENVVGIFLIVFEKKTDYFKILAKDSAHIDTGYGVKGIMAYGNKGGVGISLKLNNLDLAIVTSHLAANEGKADERKKDFHAIWDRMKFSKRSSMHLKDHDAVIWLGDLNYRVDTGATFSQIISDVKAGHHMKYFKDDELTQQRTSGAAFAGFEEEDIDFKPTFKFTPNSAHPDPYDMKKERKPAWCDRILYWKKNNNVRISSSLYFSIPEVIISDHKPVQGFIHLNLHVEGKPQNRMVLNDLPSDSERFLEAQRGA